LKLESIYYNFFASAEKAPPARVCPHLMVCGVWTMQRMPKSIWLYMIQSFTPLMVSLFNIFSMMFPNLKLRCYLIIH